MATTQSTGTRDPRNQPDGSHDQDRHGRKQNAGSNQDSMRDLGSRRDPDSKDMREERAKRPGPR